MARPESTKDVTDRLVTIGNFQFDKLAVTPSILKHYTAMLEAVEKMGGENHSPYSGSVELRIPRTQRQLEEQLRSDQYTWDATQKDYRQAVKADPSDPVAEYKRNRVSEWAKAEGLPDPYDAFAANDEELKQIRREFGFEDDE